MDLLFQKLPTARTTAFTTGVVAYMTSPIMFQGSLHLGEEGIVMMTCIDVT